MSCLWGRGPPCIHSPKLLPGILEIPEILVCPPESHNLDLPVLLIDGPRSPSHPTILGKKIIQGSIRQRNLDPQPLA